jgi:hypothetical protein
MHLNGLACMYLKNNTISSLEVRYCNREGPWAKIIIQNNAGEVFKNTNYSLRVSE